MALDKYYGTPEKFKEFVDSCHSKGIAVIADMVFTASAVMAQPVTGVALAYVAGYSLTDFWIVASVALYVFVGLCWLPVLWLQQRMRDLAVTARQAGSPLPPQFPAPAMDITNP